jgi:hypothetical protein
MSFRIGDKVSFINEKQDGYIVFIKADNTCVVEIEDGFTLDAGPKELVKIQEASKKNPQIENADIIVQSTGDALPDLIKIFSLENQVALVAVPDAGKVLSGKVDYYLVNGSELDVLYVFSLLMSKMHDGKIAGVLAPGNFILLSSVSREDLIEAEKLVIELLFYKKGLHPSYPRVQQVLNIEMPALIQNFPAAPSPFSFAISSVLINFGQLEDPDLSELLQKYKSDSGDIRKISKPSVSPGTNKRQDTSIKDFGLNPSQNEIDLHIEELIDDTSGLSASEMIQIQLNVFRKELDKALHRGSHKIIFIHGIGNGRLKNELRNELKLLKINFRDGAYDRYGAGATEVILN